MNWWGMLLVSAGALSCGTVQPRANQSAAAAATAKPTATARATARPAVTTPQETFDNLCRERVYAVYAEILELARESGAPTLENTLQPFDALLVELDGIWNLGTALYELHPDAAMRTAGSTCRGRSNEVETALMLESGVYERIAALDVSTADRETQRYKEVLLRRFVAAGVKTDAPTRVELKRIDYRIGEVYTQFLDNVAADVRSVEAAPAELAGLPSDYLTAHPAGQNGTITVTTRPHDYLPVLLYAKSPELRRKLYVARRSRGDRNNAPVLRELLQRRHRHAQLLGHASFADYHLQDTILGSARAVDDLLQRVAKALAPRVRDDYARLLARKRRDTPSATAVYDWEKAYYDTRIQEEELAFDARAAREYFPYAAVRDGLLALTAELFDLEYVKVTDSRAWHPDVEVYDVLSGARANLANGAPGSRAPGSVRLARIFLDMHPREGKFAGAATLQLTPGVRGKQLPEAVLRASFPSGLLEHAQVALFFHEFGHVLHLVFAGGGTWYGLRAVERDFNEAPAIVFEQWAERYDVLQRFAKHHQTGATIPRDLVERMSRARRVGLGHSLAFELYLSALSLELYRRAPDTLDLDRENQRLMEAFTPFAYVPDTSFHLSFEHLTFQPGSYYRYVLAQVLARDLISPLEQRGVMDHAWARRYRDEILAPGSAKPARELIAAFLGREHGYAAFERWLRPNARQR